MNQIFAEFATKHGFGDRDLVVATRDNEFHRHLSLCLARRTDDHVATSCARYGAVDSNQTTLDVDLDHFQVLRALLHGAHVARHLLTRENATRGLALTQRTRRAMRQRVTVSCIAHTEVVALDGALETLTLGDALDVYFLADLEDVRLDFAADGEIAEMGIFNTEFPQAATRFHLRLREVACSRLVDQRGTTGANGNLHGAIAVNFDGLDLRDAVRSCFDQRDRYRAAVFSEDAAHTSLAAHEAQRIFLRHGRRPQVSLIWTSTPAASSSFISASTVLSFGSTISSTRLCVRVSYWSRASLSACGDTRMV
ncbi:hypothetical protein XOO3583 [Xanthomonas oryzae pv. oryzae KACC 10331]|uniref:Uncharacterized protein n=1 Tax=Xanthomonas oryzae pv. oryzae (strain KACC10331 / KXO85) TaxID=291331 RepID=Q5GWT4_XANOR|nr:hypothetical protein XOO3583 [Xanthomonas oryzae pv. oryzae KACC 10331]